MNIFITGASKGIGRELVKLLVKNGHTVWGVARRDDLLYTLEKEIGKDHFFHTQCDVGNIKDVLETMRFIRKRSFHPDVVILNAAIYMQDLTPHYSHRFMTEVFTTNLFGALFWVEMFLPLFLARRSGHFIAISSTSAFRPDPGSLSLPASKAALSMAFRSLRLRYESSKIIFSTIHFGPVATSISPKYVSPIGRPKYPFVLTAAAAAKDIAKVIRERRSHDYFFPVLTTLIFRLTLFLPDNFFARVSRFLKKSPG